MADSTTTALSAISPLLDTDIVYAVRAGVSRKVTIATFKLLHGSLETALAAHLSDTSAAHSADAIDSASTVGTGNVEDDLSTLDAEKADGVETGRHFTALGDMLGGLTLGAVSGVGSRSFYEDDFRWHLDVATSGQIGETFNRRTGGTSALGSNDQSRPGVVRLSTTATINTYTALYPNAAGFIKMDQWFELHMWFRPVNINADVLIRAGISSDPTSESPTDGVFIEKLGADSAFWRNVTRIASAEDRHTSALGPATVANEWVHLRIRRLSATHVGIASGISGLGIALPLSAEESVAFNPGVFGLPFIALKNGTAAAKLLDVDRWGWQRWDQLR
jgi:hypothetical protein